MKRKNNLIAILLGLFLSFISPTSFAQTIADYSALPPFMSRSLLPNIMLVVDNSGSMLRFAYFDGWTTPEEDDDNWGTNSSTPCTQFNPSFTYYGYFKPDYWYRYSSSRFYESNPKTSPKQSNDWDGNFLNWLTMRRVDVLRKALTGGRVVASGSENRLVAEAPDSSSRGRYKQITNAQNYTPFSGTVLFDVYASGGTARITVGSNSYDIKVAVGTTPTGVLQQVGTKARWGLTFFNTDHQGGKVYYSVTDRNLSTLTGSVLNAINNTTPSTNTPLAETLWTVGGYFAQTTSIPISSIGPRYHSGDYTINANNDPYNYGTGGQTLYAPCAKSFVLLITDGEPCHDGYMSEELRNYANDRSTYNCTSTGGVGDPCYIYPCSAGGYVPGVEDVALYIHTNDLRSDLDGAQTLDLYTVFVFGGGSELLKYAAVNGGFTDKNNNNQPDLTAEWDEDGDGNPDNYFVASEGYDLEEKLIAAINAMLKKVASGTSVAVLSTTSSGEGTIFQAYFEPSVFESTREVRWVGHLQGLWVDHMGNLREDTVNDGALVYTEDKIIKYTTNPYTYEPQIEKYSDSDGDGNPDSTTPDTTIAVKDASPIWEAGKLLAKKTASSRKIYTFKDSDGDGLPDSGEFIEFLESNASALQPYLRASTETEARNIIKFIRGEQVSGYRDRQLTVDGTTQIWKLGDIVYSTPTASGSPAGNYHLLYGDTSYYEYYQEQKEREIIVCVGANDGMLHAFWSGKYHSGDNPNTTAVERGWYEDTRTDLNLGDEIWAYIPGNLLPHLKWLTDPNYGNNNHVYYVDLKPRIADVRIFPTTGDSKHKNGWGTVLIGGMRLGGGSIKGTGSLSSRTFRSAYFALDITDPENPELLWEYNHPELGYTTSYPAIVKVGSKWFAVFGSGPTNLERADCDNTSKQGKIFVVDIATGSPSQIFTTNETGAFMSDPVAIDLNLDYNIDLIYIGETYDAGTTYGGKMYRLWAKNSSGGVEENPANWVSPSVFFTTPAAQPITSAAAAAYDNARNLWVFFGTGKFMGVYDKTDSYQQAFYGIKEPCITSNCSTTVETSSLFNSTNVQVWEENGNITVTGTGITEVDTWSELLNTVKNYSGWYYNLWTSGGNPSERVLYRPVVFGGIVLFTTFIPNSDVCGYGGSSNLFALNFTTGTANNQPVIGKVGTEIVKKESLGSGMASGVVLHVVTVDAGGGGNDIEKTYVQMSTGAIIQKDVETQNQQSGITSWRQTR